MIRGEALKTPVLDTLEGGSAGPGDEERGKAQDNCKFGLLASSGMTEPGSFRSSALAPIQWAVGQGGVGFWGKGLFSLVLGQATTWPQKSWAACIVLVSLSLK